ncbi:hypothetical protein [Burkholderia contaminans]|uniref:hypothetical protein n=1 Tax=Burkholderia contaminans TaxID=488447 RepID=UPI0008F4C898|nr:hypothetical protein [Burkholderia contaminans]
MGQQAEGNDDIPSSPASRDALEPVAGAAALLVAARGMLGAVDIEIALADVVLLDDDLRRIPTCMRLCSQCRHTATINAAIYLARTLAVIALAATGMIGAMWAAILHNVGTFIVIANAGRLLRIDEDGHGA